MFYQELINDLNNSKSGITIGSENFNVICYADDILLLSTTSSGLQTLIDKADSYLKSHGLIFNSQKTECMISGLNPFNVVPNWTIDNVTLQVVPSIKYLGTILNGNTLKIENKLPRKRFILFKQLD